MMMMVVTAVRHDQDGPRAAPAMVMVVMMMVMVVMELGQLDIW